MNSCELRAARCERARGELSHSFKVVGMTFVIPPMLCGGGRRKEDEKEGEEGEEEDEDAQECADMVDQYAKVRRLK